MMQRGVLMSKPMVRQIRARVKTSTRRVADDLKRCPFGVVGDQLWIREAWRLPPEFDAFSGKNAATRAGRDLSKDVCYIADEDAIDPLLPWSGRYRHARFMPRWASRLLLEITATEIQKLCTISRDAVRREGIPLAAYDAREAGFDLKDWHEYDSLTAEQNFAVLWDSLNGERAPYASNPYVWVVDFKLISDRGKAA